MIRAELILNSIYKTQQYEEDYTLHSIILPDTD